MMRSMILKDIYQRGDVVLEDIKTFRDYITEYMFKAKDDQIRQFSQLFSLDEGKFRNIMSADVTELYINEFDQFDNLKDSVDRTKAREYFKKVEGEKILPFKINI